MSPSAEHGRRLRAQGATVAEVAEALSIPKWTAATMCGFPSWGDGGKLEVLADLWMLPLVSGDVLEIAGITAQWVSVLGWCRRDGWPPRPRVRESDPDVLAEVLRDRHERANRMVPPGKPRRIVVDRSTYAELVAANAIGGERWRVVVCGRDIGEYETARAARSALRRWR